MISLHFWCHATIFSSVSPTHFSEVENPGLVEPVESESRSVTPLFPIPAILSRFAGGSSLGVKSILKSQVCTNFAHPGDSM